MLKFEFLALLAFSCFFTVEAQIWQDLYDEASEYYQKNEYNQCLEVAERAWQLSIDQFNENSIPALYSLKLLSIASKDGEYYEKGITYGHREIKIYDNLEQPDSVYFESLRTLTENYLGAEQYDTVVYYLAKLMFLSSKINGDTTLQHNQIVTDLGLAYFRSNNLKLAIHYLEEANKKLENIEGGSEDFLLNLLSIGQSYYRLNNKVKAEQSLNELRSILEANGLQSDIIYAQVLEDLGLVQYDLDNYLSAEKNFKVASRLYAKFGYPEEDISDLLNNLALVLIKNGKQNESDSVLALMGSKTTNENILINQLNLATTKYSERDFKTSREILDQIFKEIATKDDNKIFAEALLLSTKVSLEDSESVDLDTINLSINLFTDENNGGKLTESYYYRGKIYDKRKEFSLAEADFLTATNTFKDNPIANQLKYLIYSGLVKLYFENHFHDKAKEAYLSFIGHLTEAETRQKLEYDYAILLQLNGYSVAAREVLIQLTNKTSYPDLLKYKIALGKVLLDLEHFNEAMNIFEQVEVHLVENGQNSSVKFAENLAEKARVRLIRGEYALAEGLFRNSIQIMESDPNTARETLASTFDAFAIFNQTVSNYPEARLNYQKALNYAQPGSLLEADIIQNLGTLSELEGDLTQSIDLLNKALVIYAELYGDKHPYYGVALQNLSTDYKEVGDYLKAVELMEEAIAIDELNQLDNGVGYSTKLHNLAVLMQEMEQLEKSRELFEKVLILRRSLLGENHPDYVFTVYSLAVLAHKMGDIEKAKELFEEMISKYLYQVNNFFPYLTEKGKTAYYGKIKETFSAYHDFIAEYAISDPSITGELYDFQLETKAILLGSSVNIRNKILSSNDSELTELFDNWLQLKEQIIKFYSYTKEELQASSLNIEDLEAKANVIEKDLSLKTGHIGKEQPKVSWRDIQAALGNNEAAVEIFRIRKNIKNDSIWYVALVVKKSLENPEFVILKNGSELDTRYFSYYKNSTKFKVQDDLSFINFWKPIYDQLKGIKTVYLSPDGVYNKINLNILNTAKNNSSTSFVIDEINIRYLTNTKEILRKSISVKTENRVMNLYGNPLFQTSESAVQNQISLIIPLPGTKNEILSIDSLLKLNNWESHVYTEEEANEKNIKNMARADVLHIATHGFFLSDKNDESEEHIIENNPLMRSGLLLTGSQESFVNNRIILKSNKQEDGVLTASEVLNMNLTGTDLVVLSACETGLGEVVNGEGVYGLQRALIIAGANSVIMSLWRVDDVVTKELMIKFYKYYLEGRSKFESLTLAQKEIRSKQNLPYYWGAFVITGI